MKEKRGFTLIELLAVIVILAIIALIAVPVIMNIISKASKSAFKDSAYGIVKAGELYYMERDMLEDTSEEVTFTFPEANGLDLKGSKPVSGTMIINIDGNIKLAISNGRWCARKNYNESEVTLDDDIENCTIGYEIKIEDIKVSDIEINVGETKKVEVEIKPANATNKNLEITSSDESIVKVKENGEIEGVALGTTTIKIKTLDGTEIEKEITITVKQPVLGLEVSSESLSLMKDDTYKIEVTITPDDASNKSLKWTSLDESIATVDNEGNITGVSAGETKVTVETQDGTNLKKEISVTVRQLVESLELDKTSITIYTGESDTVTATVLPEVAYLKAVKWTSLNPEVATVEGGVITGISAGPAEVIAETIDGSNLSKKVTVTVKPKVNPVITTENACLTEGTCESGTELCVNVNATSNYCFYVIDDDGDNLTLIMDRNLESQVAWITKEDYIAAGGKESDYGANGNANKGPLTALKTLKKITNDWTNVPAYNYTLIDDGDNKQYSDIEVVNVRARMLTKAEAISLGCSYSDNSCSSWLEGNLNWGGGSDQLKGMPYGYWLSTSQSNDTAYDISREDHLEYSSVNRNSEFGNGLRPVIKIPKMK